MATTTRRRVYTSMLFWKYPTFQLEMVGSVDLRDTILLIELLSSESRSVDSETVYKAQ
jgi:hypothetical protein